MKIKRLVIENFKSIERIELIEPNPFTVFVGPNGSGKSNIFEGLEFFNLAVKTDKGIVESLFGGKEYFLNRRNNSETVEVLIELDKSTTYKLTQRHNSDSQLQYTVIGTKQQEDYPIASRKENQQLLINFSHLFVRWTNKQKLNYSDDSKLTLSADNMEKVLKRVLNNLTLRDEIFEWLELFIPGFKSIEIDDRNELHWFENSTPEYFTKDLISDGTYNILALLTAVYQSEEPQFLCIEELENGLNPKVVKEFVNLCRYACEEFGHYIWLNTHSESLVSQLTPDEIILVDKKEGATQIKQIKGMDLHDLPMDEAWLSNALGGGIPW
jgi:predicted ATPase